VPADELTGPVVYSWWWVVLGVLAMAAVVGYLLWAFRSTRPARDPVPDYGLPYRVDDRFAHVRPVYLARVDAVEQRYRAGDLDARGLHLELSAVVRDFATVRRGVDASVLTLSELRRVQGTRRLAALIESYYRPAFDRTGPETVSVDDSLDGARRVIRQW
jgi:hypothetical protein